MSKTATKHRKGFTIIEVVLVLAIAGLIFLMIFIAFPALQRGQRNTQRRRDLSMIVSQMNRWRVNNSGTSVSDNYSKAFAANGFCTFYNHYIDDTVVDPSTGEPYKAALWGSTIVVNCKTGDEIDRKAVDDSAIGRSPSSYWAKMEPGDIQFDDVAVCDGETFNDELGRSAGLHAFAFRVKLEGGSTLCIDNGYKPASVLDGTPFDPISTFGIIEKH